MVDSTRRSFLKHTAIGLAAAGVSGLVLRSDAHPTQQVSRDSADRVLVQLGSTTQDIAAKPDLKRVTPQPYGPFYRTGAPFRGKLSLPSEPGYQPLVTEIHFVGDPKKCDPMYRIENAIAVETHKTFESGVFDIVLEREKISG
jgi:hypothetical protein